MERLAMVVMIAFLFTLLSSSPTESANFSHLLNRPSHLPNKGLCAQLIQPSGYPCTEHTVQTKDGYLLGMQRVSSSHGRGDLPPGPPVLLQHGLLIAGDSWFLNSKEQSLGFILADSGFDVWVGNVRGTDWSPGHVTMSKKDKEGSVADVIEDRSCNALSSSGRAIWRGLIHAIWWNIWAERNRRAFENLERSWWQVMSDINLSLWEWMRFDPCLRGSLGIGLFAVGGLCFSPL